MLPKRQIHSVEEFTRLCPEAKDLFLDGTERPTQKPSTKQGKKYSGKKRCHTRKNSIISSEDRKILFLSPTKSGRLHDFKQVIKANVLRYLPDNIALWVDNATKAWKETTKRGAKSYMKPNKIEDKSKESQK